MTDIDQRAALERLIKEQGHDYAKLSRLVGRNSAYIHQFIKRGSPRRLDEKDRRTLAQFFGVSEEELGGPAPNSPLSDSFARVPRLDIGASAGPGGLLDDDSRIGHIAFDPRWLRRLTQGRDARLSLIRVQGDSMAPTLLDGDDILVDSSDGAEGLRDGIYVLRRDDTLMVKRVGKSPAARQVTIKSDNDAYPSWEGLDVGEIQVIGRVIWTGRRLA